jgi:hypothetical protein
VEGEVMADLLTEPRKHLALDTDWTSAAGMGFLLILLMMLATRSAIRIVHGPWTVEPITWQTWLLVGMCAWFFFSASRTPYERSIRIISVLMAIGPVSRILLRMFHATIETELFNAAFVRVINGIVDLGGCVFVVWWFKSKIRYV